MYVVISGYTEPNESQAFKEWLLSDEVEDLTAQIEEETGVRYVETYFTILGFGEYTFETWWELPTWAGLDEMRESEAAIEFTSKMLTFTDQSRSGTARALRTPADVQVTEPNGD